MLNKYFLCFSLLLYATGAHADAIGKLESFIAATRSGQAEFTQELLDKQGKRLQLASGTMQFERPGRFRWTYRKPYQQLIIGDGRKFWLYDIDLNQVTTRKLDTALGSSPAALLSGSNEIGRGFVLKDMECTAAQGMPAVSAPVASGVSATCPDGQNQGLEWLEAIPKNHETSIEKIRMAFDQHADLVVMELYDSFGHHTLLHFSDLQRNPKLSPKLFKFVPPKDADVLSDE